MDKFLDTINIIGRIDGWLAMLRYGRGVELRWKGMTGMEVNRMLRRYGVKTYAGRMPAKNVRTVRVRSEQGKWAERLCIQYGVPLTGLIYAENANVKRGNMPKPWDVPARPVGLFGMFGAMFGSGRQPQIVTAARRMASRVTGHGNGK